MSFEEKGAWITGVVAAVAYAALLPLTVGGSIVVSIVLHPPVAGIVACRRGFQPW